MTPSENSHYKIVSVILIESVFKRELLLIQEEINPFNKVDIFTRVEIDPENPDKFVVFVDLKYSGGNKGKDGESIKKVEFKVAFAGIFLAENRTDISFKTFTEVNAPAIIYPYIREHLMNLSLKAELLPIILPLLNFTKREAQEILP